MIILNHYSTQEKIKNHTLGKLKKMAANLIAELLRCIWVTIEGVKTKPLKISILSGF